MDLSQNSQKNLNVTSVINAPLMVHDDWAVRVFCYTAKRQKKFKRVLCVSECQLEQLKERIQQSMKTLPTPKLYTWKSVQGCVVIGSDMRWYRGQLLEVVGEHVKVIKTHTHTHKNVNR